MQQKCYQAKNDGPNKNCVYMLDVVKWVEIIQSSTRYEKTTSPNKQKTNENNEWRISDAICKTMIYEL